MKKLPEEVLAEARKKKGWTQTDMAEKIATELKQGYSLRQYQKLEEGKFPKFKTEVISKIDQILGTNLYELIYEPVVDSEKGSVSKNDNSQPTSSIDPGLLTLIKANADLATAIKGCQEDQHDLITMYKEERATVRASQETSEAVYTKLAAIQEFVIQFSLSKQPYHSKEEALAALNIITGDLVRAGK